MDKSAMMMKAKEMTAMMASKDMSEGQMNAMMGHMEQMMSMMGKMGEGGMEKKSEGMSEKKRKMEKMPGGKYKMTHTGMKG